MLRPGQVIVICVLSLLCIGVVMVNSAGMAVRPDGDAAADAMSLFESLITSRPVAYLALALAALTLTAFLPLDRLIRSAEPADGRAGQIDVIVLGAGMLVLLGVICTVYIPGLGREVNGSTRWVEIAMPGIGPQSIQPSEVAKWGLVVLLAWYAARRAERMKLVIGGLVPALAATGVIAGLVALEDLGTGVLIAAAACVLLVAAGARIWPFVCVAPIGAACIAGLILASPYRLERIRTFIDPYADPQGSGYHMIQSMTAIAGGEGPGRGLGHGLQKFGYLPEDRTDFVFSVISEELGIAGAGLVIALHVALLWACLAIVRSEPRRVLQLAGLGVAATVGMQAAMNLAVVTGLAPTKGIALPLVSAGGTGWLLTSAALGLLVAMERTSLRAERREKLPRYVHVPEDVEFEDLEPEIVVTPAGAHATT